MLTAKTKVKVVCVSVGVTEVRHLHLLAFAGALLDPPAVTRHRPAEENHGGGGHAHARPPAEDLLGTCEERGGQGWDEYEMMGGIFPYQLTV